MYKSSVTGKVYKDYDEYCNSDDLEVGVVALKLQSGERTPKNEEEREILKEIRELEAQGKIVDIPFGTF
ncbi:MAG: hypothetical protein IKW86_01260 [Salinivirgaceae bacterium]|nr:hypothetical protein [Salinivirgaceae bacterium]